MISVGPRLPLVRGPPLWSRALSTASGESSAGSDPRPRAARSAPGAVAAYRHGLSLGGSRPLPELFAAAGVRFDLSADMLRTLIADIEQSIAD